MHIDITPEALLTQFDYHVNPKTVAQMKSAIANTKSFDNFSKHLLSLKDEISHVDGFIALSNSHNYFKIKCEENNSKENIEIFTKAVKHWADKYKITLQQVVGRPTYYIIGQN